MKVDVFTSTGSKKGQVELPETLFAAPINQDLMHQAVVRQQSNRRTNIAYVKSRGEVVGTTKKAYQQKHTGRARRGALRSPLVRGGGKAFGPKNDRNFIKDMPKSMWRAALRSSLSLQAKQGAIIALDSYPETVKTKDFVNMLKKMPVEMGRRLLIVLPATHDALYYSSRNIPRLKTVTVQYLNPLDVLQSRNVIFVGDSIEKADAMFGKNRVREIKEIDEVKEIKETKPKTEKKAKTTKKAPAKKSSSKSK